MLLLLAAIPLLISCLLGLAAPWIGRRLPPATAVRVLTPAALVAALTTGFCLAVLAFNALARVPAIARLGHWSWPVDPDDGTPPAAAGVALAVLVTILLLAAARHTLGTAVAVARTSTACRGLSAADGDLAVVDDDVADAFAVPGLRGRIVITTAMLDALDRRERAVLVAHERAHLAHHHQLLVQLVLLAASADPLLVPVAREIRVLTERWADEVAADAVDDRRLAARAVARAALARSSSTRSGSTRSGSTRSATGRGVGRRSAATLGVAGTGVPQRVQALTRPRQQPRHRLTGAVAALALTGLLATLLLAHTTETKFERADATVHVVTAPRR
jgi:Zn-dependent protease with chaperone function